MRYKIMSATNTGVELKTLNFCEDSESYSAEYDAETTSPSMAVITALTRIFDVAPTDLNPLHYSIDTEALNEFVSSQDATGSPVQISFTFEGYKITVTSSCELTVEPLDDSTELPTERGDEPV